MFMLEKGGLFSILVQNSPKITKEVLVFRKVARSCSLTKKLLKILKVAKKLPSRIWKGLVEVLLGILGGGVPPVSPNPDPILDQKMSLFTPVFRLGL